MWVCRVVCLIKVRSTKVLTNVDMSSLKDDHLMTMCALTMQHDPNKARYNTVHRRQIPCSREMLHRKEVQQKISDALRQAPKVPWEVEPTTHQHTMEDFVRGVLQEVVPPASVPPHKALDVR